MDPFGNIWQLSVPDESLEPAALISNHTFAHQAVHEHTLQADTHSLSMITHEPHMTLLFIRTPFHVSALHGAGHALGEV